MENGPETRAGSGREGLDGGRGAREGMLRALDANLNRAAEGLRVADDLARFVLDDAGLSGEFKSIRHGLVGAVRGVGGADAAVRVLARDTAGDVGAAVTTVGEAHRPDVGSVAAAACGRAAEAMRSIEEACKVLGSATAAREVEALRYRVYTAGAMLTLRLGGGGARQWRLCVLITESLCTHVPWERVVEAAIAGGADCFQLREKAMDSGELLRRARRLVEIARAHAGADGSRASVVVNDRPDVAVLAGADGVHVGQSDLSVEHVRRLAGYTLRVGVSTANVGQARRAKADGADSVGLGPMFVSGTKPKPELAGVDYLRVILVDSEVGPMPHLAISGITPENVGELWTAGCRGVAVSSAVCGATNPRAVCEALVKSK